jgi:hypothetical protein
MTVASASASDARSSALSSSTSTAPASTISPSRKRMAVMTLAMRGAISTASRARVVPSASTSSTSMRSTASVVTTATGGRSSTGTLCGAAPLSPVPNQIQAASPAAASTTMVVMILCKLGIRFRMAVARVWPRVL